MSSERTRRRVMNDSNYEIQAEFLESEQQIEHGADEMEMPRMGN